MSASNDNGSAPSIYKGSIESEQFVQKGAEGRVTDGIPEDLNNGLKYFNNRLCPFAHRAWWTVYEKQIENEIDYIHIELGPNKPKWYSEIQSLGTVPFVVDNGKKVYESMIIAEYFDEKFPNRGTKIYPEDVQKKATARLLISRFGDKVTKHLYELLSNPNIEDQERLRENLRNALVDFNKDINQFAPKEDYNGPYLLGEFSALDIAVIPFLDRFTATLKYYRDYDLLSDAPEYDRLYSAFNASKSRPAFQATSQLPEFYCWAYISYAKKRLSDE